MTLAKIFIYLISSIFMFFAGNMHNWLFPWLERKGIPTWITTAPATTAILFVFATLINMWFVANCSPKETNELTEKEKSKIIKKEAGKQKKAIDSLNAEHKKEVSSKCDAVRLELDNKIYSLHEECERKQVTIDVLSAELTKARQEQTNTLHANVKKPTTSNTENTISPQPSFPDWFSTHKDRN